MQSGTTPSPSLLKPEAQRNGVDGDRDLPSLKFVKVPRSRRPRRVEAAAFTLYLVTLAIGIAHHEPWADEVQSWLLARDLSPLSLVVHQLRYEGSPGLWQFILWPFAHAHLPLLTLNIIGGVLAALGVALLIFVSPLPLTVRLLVPFTFYFAFQYAVVARPYNLLIPLFGILAVVHSRRQERPMLYTSVLGLISAVSVQTMVVAGALFLLFLIDSWKLSLDWSDFRSKFGTAVLLYAAVAIALVAVLWPTNDNSADLARTVVTDPLQIFKSVVYLAFGTSFTGVPWLNISLLVSVGLWLWSRHAFAQFAVPFIALVLFSATKLSPFWLIAQPWFSGINVLLLMFAAWNAITEPKRSTRRAHRGLTVSTLALLVVAASVQVWGTASALVWDAQRSYGNGKEVASFLTAHRLIHGTVDTAGQYAPIDLEPYLPGGHFGNVPVHATYFRFSIKSDLSAALIKPLAEQRADVIVSTPQGWSMARRPKTPRFAGYELVAGFDGNVFWPDSTLDRRNGFKVLVYVRDDLIEKSRL